MAFSMATVRRSVGRFSSLNRHSANLLDEKDQTASISRFLPFLIFTGTRLESFPSSTTPSYRVLSAGVFQNTSLPGGKLRKSPQEKLPRNNWAPARRHPSPTN